MNRPSPPHTFSPSEDITTPRVPEARPPGLLPLLLPRYPRDNGGDLPPDGAGSDADPFDIEPPRRRAGWKRLLHPFFLIVLLPTLVTTAFEYLVAADQYESSAQFIVRSPQQNPSTSSLEQMLGIGDGASNADAHSVDAYLLSHDAIEALGPRRLVTMFRRPEADPVTRLWFADPRPETLLGYFLGKVHVTTAAETGITTLSVRGFRPMDAQALADDLLKLGEKRVNLLNQRMFENGLSAAERQVSDAEAMVEQVEDQMTNFRQARRDTDPEKTSTAEIELAASLQQQAAQARAQFEVMAAVLPHNAPQYAANARKAAALERQVETAKARLAGSERSVAGGLGEYEKLQLRQQFAAKRFEAAQANYQSAREQIIKQQLFIVPVVNPNLPGKSLYPQRLSIIAIVFFGLMFAYAIGWLILAGVREHAE